MSRQGLENLGFPNVAIEEILKLNRVYYVTWQPKPWIGIVGKHDDAFVELMTQHGVIVEYLKFGNF
jgi:hypothetical protein